VTWATVTDRRADRTLTVFNTHFDHEGATAHHGPTSTFNGFGPAVQPTARIDYLFVRGPLTVARHGTLADRWGGSSFL